MCLVTQHCLLYVVTFCCVMSFPVLCFHFLLCGVPSCCVVSLPGVRQDQRGVQDDLRVKKQELEQERLKLQYLKVHCFIKYRYR